MELIAKENIKMNLKAESWPEAIKVASNSLIESGSITSEYVNMMINSVNELGPYIVLLKGFALAHSAPCKEVLKDDLAIGIFDTPIDFKSDKGDVKVIMVLASKDGKSHVERLSGIARKMMDDENFVDYLINAKDVQEVYDLLNR